MGTDQKVALILRTAIISLWSSLADFKRPIISLNEMLYMMKAVFRRSFKTTTVCEQHPRPTQGRHQHAKKNL